MATEVSVSMRLNSLFTILEEGAIIRAGNIQKLYEPKQHLTRRRLDNIAIPTTWIYSLHGKDDSKAATCGGAICGNTGEDPVTNNLLLLTTKKDTNC